jgi:uncharacterized membrane protein YccC
LHSADELALRSLDAAVAAPVAPETARHSRSSSGRAFADRRGSLTDPGRARLRAATRALIAAVAAVGSTYLLFDAIGTESLPPALFGGFVAMLSTGVAVDKSLHGRKLTSVLVVLPIGVVVLLAALLSDSRLWTGVALVAVAFTGRWLARFGPRWGALGQTAFMAYYFALILRLELSDVRLYAAAAALGVAWAYVANYVVLPERPRKVLRSGLDGFGRTLASSMDPLVDAVSWARWDPDIQKRVGTNLGQLHRGAAFLSGQLTGEKAATGVVPVRATELRLRLFDVGLAAAELNAAAREVTGTTVSLEVRGRLAGRIERLQDHLARVAALPLGTTTGTAPVEPAPGWRPERAPEDWPRPARAVVRAVDELGRSTDVLHQAELAALDPTAPEPPPDDDAQAAGDAPTSVSAAPTGDAAKASLTPLTRHAVQAAVATAAGLGIGGLVSQTHQYWATISAYQVLGGTDGETFVKGAQRVAGTVAGAAVGFGVVLLTDGNAAAVIPMLAIALFASTYYRPVSASVATFWQIMLLAGIYEFLGKQTSIALELRVLETLLGSAVALVVAWWILPTHTRTKLNGDLARLATHVGSLITSDLGRLTGDRTASLLAVQQQLLEIDKDTRTIEATADPLRRSAGTLESGGIEDRLTAIWSLTADTRHLVRLVEQAVASGVELPSQDWADWRDGTGQNVAALVAALNDRVPGQVRADLGDDAVDVTTPAERTEDAIVRRLARINQTLVFLVDNVSPGAVAAASSSTPQATARV